MRSRRFSTRSWCWRRTERGGGTVRFLGQPGKCHDLDALLNQGARLVGRGGTADGPLLDLFIVDLARFLRETAAHVLRIRFEHPPHCAHQVAVARRGLFLGDRHVPTRARGDIGGHDRLPDFTAIALGAADLCACRLHVVRRARSEPGFELVGVGALQAVADHDATSFGSVSAAYTTSNGRSCRSDGTWRRTSSRRCNSTSANVTAG